ncbi:MAG: sulfotransferase domain-containing protein [Chloroflexi bacterium]|nr:sulfotransferase domain-containing protein [Chloroflexota bacterium]
MANEIQAATGMTSIVDSVPEDVFFVGYPKSGNTWFRYLVTGAFYGVDPEYAPHALVNSLIPNMHTKQFYMRYQTPMFFKSHGLPDPAFKRVVYLLRDGRDVMVSYFHHLRNLNEKNVDFLNMVQSGDDLFYGQWHNHVEAWLSNPFNAQIITIRYEDMKKDAVHELQRFCQFVGIEREDSFLKSTVDKASFDKMRRKEKRDGWGHSMWKGNKQFIRRGQVGSYKDEMPPNVLEAFMQNASETLHKYGYLGEN